MVNYLGRFIPNMSTITTPLYQLLKKDAAWEWHGEHDAAYQLIKSSIAKRTVLKFFDLAKLAVLQTDASSAGLGVCLLQDGHPVASAFRSPTPAEQNYAQIEKELLGIVFGAERFNQFIYGFDTAVHTNHKPLVATVKKPLHLLSPRPAHDASPSPIHCVSAVHPRKVAIHRRHTLQSTT